MNHRTFEAEDFGAAWHDLLYSLYLTSARVHPRGLECSEILGATVVVKNMRSNLFYSAPRRLNYRFAVAEWLWIAFGREDVQTIARYNSHIAKFSDDGEIFNGAYGPRIARRWAEVVELLRKDPDTRQAVVPIFGQSHAYHSKDVPCTVALQFLLRQNQLHLIVTMRSSDVWLGLPYDVFTFSMLANMMGAQLNVDLGTLRMQLGSSHLYQTNFAAAKEVLQGEIKFLRSPYLTNVPSVVMEKILIGEWAAYGLDRPWDVYAQLLGSGKISSFDGYEQLCGLDR